MLIAKNLEIQDRRKISTADIAPPGNEGWAFGDIYLAPLRSLYCICVCIIVITQLYDFF
jgi:hypothetical protein